jgi:hypothetical protein
MKKLIALFGFFCVIAGAYAVKEQVDRSASLYPLHLSKGLYVGPVSPDPTTTTTNKVTDMRSGIFRYQFGNIAAALWQPGGCVVGPTFRATGVRVGDSVDCVSDRTNWDGGLPNNVKFHCEVPGSNFIRLSACAMPNDAGITISLIDAGYIYYTRGYLPR